MPYVKTNWLDRLVQFPNKFRVNNNGDGTSDIEEAPGDVFVQGTPISAQNLNKIEQGIEDATRIAEEGTTVATQAEAETGTNNVKKMTPLRVFQAIAKRITDLIATSTEAVAGTSNVKLMSPLRTKELVDSFAVTKKLSITLANTPNLNTVTVPGMYALVQPGPNKSQNYPPTEASYSFLLVANTANAQTLQLSAGHDQQYFAYRVNYDGNWTAWRTIATTDLTGELANLTTSVKTSLVNAINELKSAQTIATQNEAEAGTDNARIMTPLRVSQSVAKRLRDNSKLELYNLFKGSYDFSGFSNASSWTLATSEDSYKNFPTRYTNGIYAGLRNIVDLEVGTYTFLGYIRTTEGAVVNAYINASNGGKVNNSDNANMSFGSVPDYTLLKFTFNVTTRGTFNIRFEKSNNLSGRVYASLLRLFEGDVERPWFEAIDDNVYNVATEAETLEGTNDSKIVTPLKLRRSKFAKISGNPTDLDLLISVGDYFYGGGARPANTPNEVLTGNGFYIEVIQSDNQLTVQRITQPFGGVVLSRTKYNTGNDIWTPWKLLSRDVATQTEAQTATNNDKVMTPLRTTELISAKYGLGGFVPLLSSFNYNDYTTSGFFRMPANALNSPNVNTGNLFVLARTSNVVTQVVFNEAGNTSYRRSKTADNTWTAWKEYVDTGMTGNLTQLQTSQKGSLVAAINEAFQFANDGKTRIAQVIGSPVVTGDTFTQMQTKIQTIKNNLGRILRLKGQPAEDTDSLSSMVAKVENITTGIRTLSGTIDSLPGDYGFRYVDGQQALSPVLQVIGLPFRPKKITVRTAQGSLLLETIYDSERGIYANAATIAQYSNEPSFNFTSKPISMSEQNGYITDSSFSIPVALPAYSYSWYIEG